MFQFAHLITDWLTELVSDLFTCHSSISPLCITCDCLSAYISGTKPNQTEQIKYSDFIARSLFPGEAHRLLIITSGLLFFMAAVNCVHRDAISSPKGGKIQKMKSRVRFLNESGVGK